MKWLGQDLRIGQCLPRLQRDGRKARNEHHARIRRDQSDFLGQFDPIQFRHHDIGEQKIESFASLKFGERMRAAINIRNRIARTRERAHKIFAHHIIIFGKQYADHFHPFSGLQPAGPMLVR